MRWIVLFIEKKINKIIKIQWLRESESLLCIISSTAHTVELAAQWSLCYWPEDLKSQKHWAASVELLSKTPNLQYIAEL